MWIYGEGGNAAYNLDHVTRLYVEETGSGAALKADIAGKTIMVGYYTSKAEAQAVLRDVMMKRENDAAVVRL